jgi:transposase-like protein
MSGPVPTQPTPRMTCPFCESGEVERIGQWGGQIITSQWHCRGCGSYFEALRDDYAAARETSSNEPK